MTILAASRNIGELLFLDLVEHQLRRPAQATMFRGPSLPLALFGAEARDKASLADQIGLLSTDTAAMVGVAFGLLYFAL